MDKIHILQNNLFSHAILKINIIYNFWNVTLGKYIFTNNKA